MAELTKARNAATAGDMVELRLDGLADVDVAAALHGRRLPVIVTCRPSWEGGKFDGSEEERRRLLARALELGAEYVDVEWEALRHAPAAPGFDTLVRQNRDRVIVSSHDFTGVPSDLGLRIRAMRGTGSAVIKVAVTAVRLTDTLPLREIARGGDAVVIGMGEAGVPSRLLASRFGSRWTYGGNGIAPGQIPVQRMVDRFRFRDIGPDTTLYGIVGDNVMHSMSPAMHNAALAAAGIDAVYVPLGAADFGDFLTFAAALDIAGASVTIPFKLDALKAAASSDELTQAVGAANTLRRSGPAKAGPYVRDSSDVPHSSDAAHSSDVGAGFGRPENSSDVGAGFSRLRDREWEATNTDVEGFLEPLEAVYSGSLKGARASVLGAGGAARAVVVALTSRGAQVTVHARRDDQARHVADALRARTGPWPPEPGSWDVLVNCTPLGGASARDASPLPGGPFDGGLVYDLTYGPSESPLLREARLTGCLTLDGLPMLVAQAERQFEWWTGTRPPAGVMREAALASTGHRDTEPRRQHA